MSLSPDCDTCHDGTGLQRVEVRIGDDEHPMLSVTLCVSCRRPFLVYVERMQRKILEQIR